MNEGKQDYTKVTELTAEFRRALKRRQESSNPFTSQEVLLWQAEFQLAMAQQLTIIAGHLGKIVGRAETL